MSNINVDDFAEQIRRALDETKDLTEKALHKAVDTTARQTVSKIKEKAPVRTGKYRKDWGSVKTSDNGRGAYGRTVRNRTRYMIAHLLQNGHGGKRPARARPHIPSDDETEKLFVQNLEREMK